MSFKTFYRIALVLPLILPVLSLVFFQSRFFSILFIFLMLSGVEYLFFVAISFVYLWRIHSIEQVQRIVWLAPLIFILFALVGSYLQQFWDRRSNPDLLISLDSALPIIVYGLMFGYGYCMLIELACRILRAFGFMVSAHSPAR